MTYEAALAYLNSLEGRGWRLGLDRMEAFVDRAGLRAAIRTPRFVHIAGTNGKGTTTAYVESILRHQGWKTGAFYSPFLIDYRERIQASGQLIPKDDLVTVLNQLLEPADAMAQTEFGGVTKFELEAAMGFAYWEREACEWVALETGLGGRLDATNVCAPAACIIVSIGLDHTAILGDTLEQIASEKAGILKPGVPAVIGRMEPEARETIEAIANRIGAPLWREGFELTTHTTRSELVVETPLGRHTFAKPPLGGEIGALNAGLAFAACLVSGGIRNDEAVEVGLREAWLPGRLDRRTVQGRTVLFDGAHNGHAARAMIQSIQSQPLRLVTNMVAGHEVEDFYRQLQPFVQKAEVVPIHSPRALPVEETVRKLRALGIAAESHATVADGLQAALSAEEPEILVTGSNFLVGEALRIVEEL